LVLRTSQTGDEDQEIESEAGNMLGLLVLKGLVFIPRKHPISSSNQLTTLNQRVGVSIIMYIL
jgi:hypothetical protein